MQRKIRQSGVDLVFAILAQVAADLYQDSDRHGRILGTAEILGVDSIAHTGITIRILINTLPLKQWQAGREYRRRLKYVVDAEGIKLGIPSLELKISNPDLHLNHSQAAPVPSL